MVNFICSHCGFRFSGNSPRECPYCGRETIEKERTAEELLGDVERE